jgi:hypothetical protein
MTLNAAGVPLACAEDIAADTELLQTAAPEDPVQPEPTAGKPVDAKREAVVAILAGASAATAPVSRSRASQVSLDLQPIGEHSSEPHTPLQAPLLRTPSHISEEGDSSSSSSDADGSDGDGGEHGA